jgi:hypothetical protein
MRPRTSPAYWPIRILLSIGIASVASIVLWSVLTPLAFTVGDSSVQLGPLLVDGTLHSRVLAVAVPIVGLLWMIRVFRGTEGEPPRWHYRDR